MRLFIALLLCAGFVSAQEPTWTLTTTPPERVNTRENFRVEPLQDAEVKQIEEADAALYAAQQRYDVVTNRIKSVHGESIKTWAGLAVCNAPITSVQLRGRYALISTTIDSNGCATMTYVKNTP